MTPWIDWAAELQRSLQRAALDSDEQAFCRTLRMLVATLRDGHGDVTSRQSSPDKVLPLRLRLMEGKAYLAWGPAGIPPGSEILAFNDESLTARSAWLRPEISAATDGLRDVFLEYRLITELSTPVAKVSFRSPQGIEGTADVPLVPYSKDRSSHGLPPTVAELRPGIWYLDLERLVEKDFNAILPTLSKARGVIFDLRGYPNLGPSFLEHLTDKPLQSARWSVPIVLEPDGRNWTWNTDGRWNLQPSAPLIQGKVVFLTGGRAASYAESCLGIVEAYRLGEIVGEPSAGTNGNINPFELPGGFKVTWTGMKVLKHDGSRHHGVGIHPTVLVRPTPQGLASNRDEVLERALAMFPQGGA